ncbi:membrane-spanning 4-domains subfamily A member 2 [Cricetulus griseus]
MGIVHKQPQMASQGFDNTGLGTSEGGTSPGSHEREDTDGSVYQLLDGPSDVQRGVLQALGATQILNGIVILALGVFLGSLQYLSHQFRHVFFFTFYTGYPFWGAVFFISSGSLTVAAGRKPTRSLGLVSLMLILTLLELAVTISVSVMWCLGNISGSRKAISSPSKSAESGIPPDGSDSENPNTQLQVTTDAPDIELLEVSPAAEALPAKPAPPPPQQTWQTVLKSDLEFLGARGSLGANIVSSIASGIGIIILILNLSHNSTYLKYCKDLNEDDGCFVTAFITEMVSMMLFLTMLAFCSAVLHTIYRIGEAFKSNKVTDDRLYEELNVYSPIYSELEDKGETSSPVGS